MNDIVESSRADLPFALPPADDGLAAFFPTFSVGILQKRR